MHDIITGTPADLTYLHPIVREAWMVVWAVTSAALVLILGWMGLSFTIQEHLGRVPAGWREMVPRLLLGLVAAATSLWWCALVLDVADAVSGFVAASLDLSAGDLLRSSAQTLLTAVEVGSVGMALVLALLYLVYGFFVLYVLLQLIMRLALIDLLVVLAPIALGLWILPHTAGWGRHWLRLFLTTVFQQAIQLIALAMGFGMLNQFADIAAFEPIQDLVWKLLLSLAFVYLATRVPSLLGNAGTFDSWMHTLHFGMALPGSMVRSARSVGMLARGGGGAGRAAGAGAAEGGGGGRGGGSGSGGGRGGALRRRAGHARRRHGRSPPERRRVAATNDTNHRRGRSPRRPSPEERERCASSATEQPQRQRPTHAQEYRTQWKTLSRPSPTSSASSSASWGPWASASSSTAPTSTSPPAARPTRWSAARAR